MKQTRSLKTRFITIILVLFLPAILLGKETFPKPVGYVNDFANVIPPDYRAKITRICLEVKEKTGAEIAVVTVDSVGPDYTPTEYANLLFEKWGIGQKGKDNGVLLLDAIKERYVWIEVGYGLEGILPDGLVGEIRDRYIVPYLKQGRRGEAYLNGVRAIAGVIAKNAGVQITGSVQMPVQRPLTSRKKRDKYRSLFWLLFWLFFIIVPIFGRKSKKKRSGFWGPWFWGGGGFGGGGGGFGGGASGGGGAGGGY
ncbi:MAG: TPM domain-containing protein [Calditrichaeota bacterium]|nr:TPM domain-containing protein [Calditrichota bacterium]